MTVRFHDAAVPPTHLPPTRGGGVLAQLTRFTLAGTSSNELYALAFLVLDGYGSLLANLIGVATSTILANELHRRLTFQAADRVRWFVAQWEGGTLAVIGLGVSSGDTLIAKYAGRKFFPHCRQRTSGELAYGNLLCSQHSVSRAACAPCEDER
ncbi:hypothetical protein ACFTWF_40250 [Rhodococcus sp. NPDC056960]|uniref:hypothetical protein n=1 Tax=Rhodococcus sp. NPDC056960 TaxID=3345982 RepID=UPI00363AA6C7